MTARPARPRVLVLTFTPFNREPRALKQVNVLKADYDVTTAGFGPTPVDGVPHIELDDVGAYRTLAGKLRYLALLGLHLYRFVHRANDRDRAAARRLAGEEWDLVIAHDVQTLQLAQRLPSRHGVLVDLHEYAPRQNEHSLAWRLLIAPYFRWICRTRVTRAAAVTTVGQGIVDEYRRRFGIEATLVINATPFAELEPGQVARPIRLVHSGIPAPARKLEIMIAAVRASTADVTFDLYLIEDGSRYLGELRERAAGEPRIRFRDPVPYEDLIGTLSTYDLGLSVIAPTTFNLAWCLPNKFFDFIQARLGVIVGPSPEMQRFVSEYQIGAVADDFSAGALAAVLDSLTIEQVVEWKAASNVHARELSSERQVVIWARLVDELTGVGPRA